MVVFTLYEATFSEAMRKKKEIFPKRGKNARRLVE